MSHQYWKFTETEVNFFLHQSPSLTVHPGSCRRTLRDAGPTGDSTARALPQRDLRERNIVHFRDVVRKCIIIVRQTFPLIRRS